MKIHILYNFNEGAWGGGNQFLKALRKYFVKEGCYVEFPNKSDVILFNSHHELKSVLRLKMERPQTIFIHRVDGPILYTRGRDRETDKIIFDFNQSIADGTVFQSKWSRNKSYELGMKKNEFETVIINAPDSEIFYPQKTKKYQGEKIKLIATSWAPNIRKGFDIYKFLDENLDSDRYEMTFVGRSPIKFKRIEYIPPQSSERLAEILRQYDIFITASRNDPCSNALIEALHCGLPAVARNDGGHPEIVGEAGELFGDKRDVLDAIEKVAQNYEYYRDRIKMLTMEAIGKRYYEFADRIYRDCLSGKHRPKQVNKTDPMKIKAKVIKWKIVSKIGMGKRFLKMDHLRKMKKLGDFHEG